MDRAGNMTRFDYDPLGRMTVITDPLGHETRFSYNELNQVVSQTDANGHVTQFEHSKTGCLTIKTLPSGDQERYTCDPMGNITSKTDYNGNTTSYTYDTRNRLTKKTFPDGLTFVYTYTSAGLLSAVTSAEGVTRYEYDGRGRITRFQNPDGAFVAYGYDPMGHIISRTTPAGTVRYTYNDKEQLEQVIAPDGGITAYTYDAVGNLASVTYPNGNQTTYTYDTLYRLTNVTNRRSGGVVISAYTYTLDLNGNRTRVEELDGTVIEYTYDALNRLTRELKKDPIGAVVHDINYTYDPVGNRLSKTINGVTISYTYDVNDRLITDGTTTYAYDNNGNLLSKTTPTSTVTYAYDHEDRLIAVNTPTTIITFGYDGAGGLARKTVDGTTTRYLVDPSLAFGQVLEERDGSGALIASYVYGTHRISMSRGRGTAYYLYDGHNSVRQLTDETEATTDVYEYDAFGVLLSHTGASLNPFLYTGEQYDPNAGFYYLRARYYDPGQGRFLTMDTMPGSPQDPSSLHRYVYTANNPVNRLDPTGHFTLIEDALVAGIMSTLVALDAAAGLSIMFNLLVTRTTENFLKPPSSASRLAFMGTSTVGLPHGIAQIGATGGIEHLYFNTSNAQGWAYYFFFGPVLSIGFSTSPTPYSLSVAVEIGHVFSCPKPKDYEGWFFGISWAGSAVVAGMNVQFSVFGGPGVVREAKSHGYGFGFSVDPMGGVSIGLSFSVSKSWAMTYYWQIPISPFQSWALGNGTLWTTYGFVEFMLTTQAGIHYDWAIAVARAMAGSDSPFPISSLSGRNVP